MKIPGLSRIQSAWTAAGRWYETTPERALDLAYDAALAIEAIENRHFGGDRIDLADPRYGGSVRDYFRSELQKNLKAIEVRLWEFRASNRWFNPGTAPLRSATADAADRPAPDRDRAPDRPREGPGRSSPDEAAIANGAAADRPTNGAAEPQRREAAAANGKAFITFKKLERIDRVLARYGRGPTQGSAGRTAAPRNGRAAAAERSPLVTRAGATGPSGVPIGSLQSIGQATRQASRRPPSWRAGSINTSSARSQKSDRPISDRTSFLPRSLLGTLDRVRRDLDDRSEDEVLQNFRSSKVKTIVSLKFVLLLILVPLLTQQVFKNFIVGPVVDGFYNPPASELFLNPDIEEEALMELERYERRLQFESLLHDAPKLSEEDIDRRLEERADEIAAEARSAGSDAISNIFADIFSLMSFGAIVAISKEEIAVLKSFIDEIMYGLSDSAKAFVIILSTDIFVGYHSTHGWEVIVSGISRHFGLPENRDFMFLFIATFPVILDAVIKYWIFRYLNRISPSAVATYKNMNE